MGGIIAGFGARLSNGCTSGHGICGLGSFQLPSLLAVLIFLVAAIVTAQAGRRVRGSVMKASTLIVALITGVLFGFGLAYSSMVKPEVVLSFLRFEDFGLLLVLGGAVVVTVVAYKVLPKFMARPVLGGTFGKHPSEMTMRTMGGALLFGVGWGLSGVCPGPAIAGLGTGNWPLLIAIAGMIVGAYVQGWLASRGAVRC